MVDAEAPGPVKDAPVQLHLLLMQHGLWGKPDNLKFFHDLLASKKHDQDGVEIKIINSAESEGRLTYDGIDTCADRLIALLLSSIKELEAEGNKVARLSIIGYSLGGCICRYVVGQLEAQGFFKPPSEGGSGITPVHFVTIATPHLGSWMPSEGVFARAFNYMVPHVASRTGYQLMLRDSHAFGRPLLVNMADPALCFHRGLQHFQQLVLMSNVCDDRSVPYCTSSIQLSNPFEEAAAAYAPDPAFPSVVVPATPEQLAAEPEIAREAAAAAARPRRGSWVLFAFLALLPVLLPLMCVMLVVETRRGRKHYASIADQKYDVSWLEAWKAAGATSDKGSKQPQAAGGAVPPTVHVNSTVSRQGSSQQQQRAQSMQGRASSDLHPISRTEDVEVSMGGDTKVTLHEGIVSASSSSQAHAHQEYMVASLGALPWVRVEVDILHRHAHAAIVMRIPWRFKHWDHLEYLASRVMGLGDAEGDGGGGDAVGGKKGEGAVASVAG